MYRWNMDLGKWKNHVIKYFREIEEDENLKTQIDSGLVQIEKAVMDDIEMSNDRVVVFEDCEKNIRSLKQTVEDFNSSTGSSVEYSAMCILHDQSMVQKESRWRREDLLNEWDFRKMTRNFLRKTW